MCRLLAYIGEPIQGDRLLLEPEHSLEVQSYHPKEMTAGLLNADGFGIGWYHPEKDDFPYTYKSLLPIWSDVNLPQISRYLESHCILAYVRSATPGLPVDLGNCQPFVEQKMSFIHNGYINNFRQTLYRPIRAHLNDYLYQNVHGTTDSEHIFALILTEYKDCLKTALLTAIKELTLLATEYDTHFSTNIILSDGKRIFATRYAHRAPVPTLYFREDDRGITLASEPLDDSPWQSFPEQSLITIDENRELHIEAIAQ
ncbi:ergothioneine biosynthesis protein EgtC [[Limnothrix rosea] IAM M-220]|uniref:ergothioneine biosynthesis protein EgtC n=1 Tax=[Limnothrix rosea] IAM M-220 TaxID=454133 RepID=UPI000968FE45|nr:ergothioneine biosynthesis protein EgtC [[Limnothrix rosea] IAM M-220]OKH18721.1 ergothioneine biosynthesis protein EgtC [[Limnothrix rosea] IAM M-220]